jgi:hypothetical protein
MNVLDLHGYTIQDAYIETIEFIKDMHNQKEITVKVITGKGEIGREFPMWIEESSFIKKCELTDDGGCWIVHMAIQKANDYHKWR